MLLETVLDRHRRRIALHGVEHHPLGLGADLRWFNQTLDRQTFPVHILDRPLRHAMERFGVSGLRHRCELLVGVLDRILYEPIDSQFRAAKIDFRYSQRSIDYEFPAPYLVRRERLFGQLVSGIIKFS